MDILSKTFITNMKKLPVELINHIFCYYYSEQDELLCYDINHYTESLDRAKTLYHVTIIHELGLDIEDGIHVDVEADKNWFLSDILSYSYSYVHGTGSPLINQRIKEKPCYTHYTDREVEEYIDNVFIKKPVQTQINLLWGMLETYEREECLLHGLYIDADFTDEEDYAEA